MKDAIGLSGFESPTLLRCTASAMAVTASGCPTTSLDSSSSSSSSFSRSDDCSLDTGILVHEETVEAMSRSVTSSCTSFRSEFAIDDSVSASFCCSAGSVMYRSSAALLRSYEFSALSMSTLHFSSSSLTACTIPTWGVCEVQGWRLGDAFGQRSRGRSTASVQGVRSAAFIELLLKGSEVLSRGIELMLKGIKRPLKRGIKLLHKANAAPPRRTCQRACDRRHLPSPSRSATAPTGPPAPP
mmetsp:Transcript_32335/g.81469  ORF Transcript_32335/g.81469 Transcript_32335/m.81469 type:complete len:242 (+) Transcript_32335:1351-2076(+)